MMNVITRLDSRESLPLISVITANASTQAWADATLPRVSGERECDVRIIATVCFVVGLVVHPALSAAQGLGAIAGTVRDTSGAVLPGVTVEVTSEALIEKARTAVTDGGGQYTVVNLPPGRYSVTFSLQGFSTFRRDGVELTANFTAPVNAELQVGNLAETVTVSGQSPLVDVQGVAQTRTVTQDVIRAIPIGGTMYQLAAMNPGVTIGGGAAAVDVGGASGSPVQAQLSAHGGNPGDELQLLDGMRIGNMMSNSGRTQATLAPLLYDQIDVQLSGHASDVATIGVVSNLIPRSGGNSVQGAALVNGSATGLQSSNLTERLRATGLTATSRLKEMYDLNGAIGGPIAKDRIWFFGMGRYQTNQSYIAGLYFPVDPTARVRVEDRTRQAYDPQYIWDAAGRVTVAATPSMRVVGFVDVQKKWWKYWLASALSSPESLGEVTWPGRLAQATWTYTATSRLLFEAGANYQVSDDTILPREGEPNTGRRIVETGGALIGPITYGPFGNIVYDDPQRQRAYRGSMSYVTGTHNFKLGMDLRQGFRTENNANFADDIQYRTTNLVLNQVTIFAPLGVWTARLNYDLGIYAQDRWTINRLTVNGSVRVEFQKESNDPYSVGPSKYLPTRNRSFPGFEVVNWKEVNPRMGIAYDLFGNGRTALKFSAARGVAQEGLNTADALNPARTFATGACTPPYPAECTFRTVNDAVSLGGNGNGEPDCDLLNAAPNGECGPWLLPFGSPVPFTRQDPDTLSGWGKRPWNWEFSTALQHELTRRLSVSAAYFRRINGNFLVTDNTANSAADFTQFPVTVPNDSRLPNAGQTLRVFDISPALVAATSNMITFASNYGKQYQHYNGMDLVANARLGQGSIVQGGVTFGRIITDNCDVVQRLPEALGANGLGANGFPLTNIPIDVCHAESGLVPQYKALGAYELPWGGVRVSASFQSLPGPLVQAQVNYTGAQLAPAIGRPFSAGAAGIKPVNVIEPGSMYGDRLFQTDLRFSKILRYGRRSIDLNVDLYNASNSDARLAETAVFGATWRRPTAVIQGRIVKFGVRWDF